MKQLILCDTNGNEIGAASWKDAHSLPGKLHRAFSAYVFRDGGKELLIQKRSAKKPLWPLFWANTCCSHPRVGEEILAIAPNRLREEFGFSCPLKAVGTYVYRAEDPSGRGVEHEHVTILKGEIADQKSNPNPDEIAEFRWISLEDLNQEIAEHPEQFAPWFPLGLQKLGLI